MTLKFGHIENRLFLIGSSFFLLLMLLAMYLQLSLLLLLPIPLALIFIFLKDVRFAFYALMFSLPLSFQFLEKYDFPDEPLMILNSGFFLFFCLFNYRKIKLKSLLLHPLFIAVMLSVIWLTVTVILSKNRLLSAKFLLKKTWYIIPFFLWPIIFFQEKKVVIRSYQLLFSSLFVIVIVVLIRFSAVGFAFDRVHDPIQPFFQNHVMYGSMVSVTLPFVVAAFTLSRKLSIQWLISLAAILFFLAGVYYSYSRAAWVAVIFAGGAYIAIRLKIMHWVILAFYVAVFALVFWLAKQNTYLSYKPKFEKTIMHESIEDHIVATIQGTDISSAERYYRWIAALRMSTDNPVFGVGPNNFYDYYKPYTITSFRTWVSRNPERSTTHNYFLFMLVEQGIPALVLYAVLIFVVFFYGQKVLFRQKDRFSRTVVMSAMCCIAAVFINNFFSELLETDKIGSLFYLSIAVILAVDFASKQNSLTERPSA
ncbi:MAG: O-antigen ligase family protein [Bacteroidetes bacterium]|nr:O-antigen ligase family protein [Bacteroidota bacterium]